MSEMLTGPLGVTQFGAGLAPGEAHFLFNASDAPCELLGFGGPDLVGSGASYPHGKDEAWRKRTGN